MNTLNSTIPLIKRMALWLGLATALANVATPQTVPPLVNYQGRLANPDGSPLPTADYTLTFKLYDDATNGSPVWGPQVFDGAVAQGHGARIPVVQGYFNVMLGPVDTTNRSLADAFNAPNRFVEVTVSNRQPIAPRQQILTTPFAFQAANSAKLAGYEWSALFGTNNPVAGTIPFSKMAQRQVGTNVGVGGVAISAEVSTNLNGTTYSTPREIRGWSVTLTTSGRPVMAFLTPGFDFDRPYVRAARGNNSSVASFTVRLSRTAQRVGEVYFGPESLGVTASGVSLTLPPGVIQFIDFPLAGTHTYSISAYGSVIEDELTLEKVRLVAFEL